MLTPTQLRDQLITCIREMNPEYWKYKVDECGIDYVKEHIEIFNGYGYPDVYDSDSLTDEQWKNLVAVCTVIDENIGNFIMELWHSRANNHCGTSHCISGWATALCMNDPQFGENNFTVPQFALDYDISRSVSDVDETEPNARVGVAMLSEFVSPFFYLTEAEYNDELDYEDQISAEKVIHEHLILPVLAEAKRDGTVLNENHKLFIETVRKQFAIA